MDNENSKRRNILKITFSDLIIFNKNCSANQKAFNLILPLACIKKSIKIF